MTPPNLPPPGRFLETPLWPSPPTAFFYAPLAPRVIHRAKAASEHSARTGRTKGKEGNASAIFALSKRLPPDATFLPLAKRT